MPLKIVRYPDRSPSWIIRGTVAGVRVFRSSGTGNRAAAERERARIEAAILERRSLGRPATLTFAEAARDYMRAGGERRFLGPLLRHFGAEARLVEIDNRAAAEAAAALYPDAAWSTVNRQVIAPLSAVYQHAAADDGLPARRFVRRKPPAGERGQRVRWCSPEEAEAWIDAAGPRGRLILLALFGTGLRTGELVALDRRELNLDTGQAWIADPKNGHGRFVQFPPRALEALRAAELPELGPILTTPKGAAYVRRQAGGGQFAGELNRARDRAGLGRDVTPHVCRHSWATWHHAQCRDYGALLDLGGWRSGAAEIYRKIAPADLGARLLAHGWDFRPAPLEPARARPRLAAVPDGRA